jgi:signal transduction histidine kinase
VGGALHETLLGVCQTGEGRAGPTVPIPLRMESGLVEERVFNLLCEPLRDEAGRGTGVIAVASEITDQVNARRALEHSEARYRTIFETAEVSIWEEDYAAAKRMIDALAAKHGPDLGAVLDANPALVEETLDLVRVLDVNPATVRMFGASSRGQLLGALRRLFDPELLLPIFKRQMLAIAAGERLFVADAVMHTLAGDRLDLATTLAVSADDAAYAHVLITLTDVSAQNLAARERDARIAEMERAVHFGEMFAGMLGHDLRNPLSAITTTAGLLAARAESETAARPARRVLASAHRMERMIAQLLDFTRVRLGGGLPVERTRCDLADICRPVIEELEPVHKRQIRLHTAGDVAGDWDRDRLSQMLSNLAGNACQHATTERPIEIRLDGTEPDRVRIAVHNDGVIPAELLPTLFEPLHRAGDAQPRRGGSSGLGLGLFITQQIALAHGGTIAVSSTEADGTSFTVDLPRAR